MSDIINPASGQPGQPNSEYRRFDIAAAFERGQGETPGYTYETDPHLQAAQSRMILALYENPDQLALFRMRVGEIMDMLLQTGNYLNGIAVNGGRNKTPLTAAIAQEAITLALAEMVQVDAFQEIIAQEAVILKEKVSQTHDRN